VTTDPLPHDRTPGQSTSSALEPQLGAARSRRRLLAAGAGASTSVLQQRETPAVGMRGSLLIVTGPPGAGKSTVARLLASRFEPSVLVDGDAFFAFLAMGAVEPWLPESAEQNDVVIQAAAVAAGRFTHGGYTTVYDGVLGPWFLPTFATATGLDQLDYAVLLPSADRCVQQVAGRTDHGFTDESATRKMHEEFAQADVESRHVIEVVGDAGEVVDSVLAARSAGALRYPN